MNHDVDPSREAALAAYREARGLINVATTASIKAAMAAAARPESNHREERRLEVRAAKLRTKKVLAALEAWHDGINCLYPL